MHVALDQLPRQYALRASISDTAAILRIDPGLAQGVPADERPAAERLLQAPVLTLSDGATPRANRSTTAYLVIDGLLLRRVWVGEGRSVELLARRDVLFPAREDAASFARSEWKAVEPVRIAAIDLGPGAPIWRWPPIGAAVAMRAIDRTRVLAVQAAIMSAIGVEERLHSLLWVLSERWGRVTGDGVALDLQVPQQVLAEMIGARRPTVSMALGRLCERGLLTRPEPGCWVLLGPPPEPAPR